MQSALWQRIGILLLMLAAVFALAACGDGGATPVASTAAARAAADADLLATPAERRLTLQLHDVRFEPARLTFKAGEIVELEVRNEGSVEHDFTIDEAEAELAMVHGPGAPAVGHEAHARQEGRALHVAVQPGQHAVLRLRVREPGTYEYYCGVAGHREAGMTGTLTVE